MKSLKNLLVLLLVTFGTFGMLQGVVGAKETAIGQPIASNATALSIPSSDADDAPLLQYALQLRNTRPELFGGAQGVLVLGVEPGSQAEQKGLQRGDIVVAYGGQPMNSAEQLVSTIQANAAKPKVKLQFIRADAVQIVVLQGGKIGIFLKSVTMKTILLHHLQEEGENAYYAADYPTALEKWQTGLREARKYGDKFTMSLFINDIGLVYYTLGEYQTALEHYQHSLAIARQIGEKRGEGNTLFNIGILYQNTENYPKALEFYLQALVIHRQVKNKQGEGNDLANIGTVYYSLEEYQKALKYHKQALAIHMKIKDKPAIGNDCFNICMVYQNLTNYHKALKFYLKALAIHRELEDKKGESSDLTNLGVVYFYLEQYQKALVSHKQALIIHREIKEEYGEGTNLLSIGISYSNFGQYQKALEHYEQALIIFRQIKKQHDEGTVLTQIGLAYNKLGQYQKALEYFAQALAIHQQLRDKKGEGRDITGIGEVYRSLGQYQKALAYYQQALVIHRDTKDERWEGSVLNNIGLVYKNLGKSQKALEYFEQSLNISRKLNDRGENMIFANMGLLYLNEKKYQKALEYSGKALKLLKKEERFGLRESMALIVRGSAYLYLGEYQKAHVAFRYSVTIATKLNTENLWLAQAGLATAELQLNKPESAIIHYEQALNHIEKLRVDLKEKEHKLSFIQDKLTVYDLLITVLQGLHEKHPNKCYNHKAFETFERKQGRIFLEEMGQSGARLFSGVPKEISQKDRELEQQIKAARENRTQALAQGNNAEPFYQNLANLQAIQKTFEKMLKNDYPDYYALKYPKPVSLKRLQTEVLKPDELMLVYGVMENSTTLWVIGKDTFQVFDLPLPEKRLTEKVTEIRLGVDWKLDTRTFERTDVKEPLSEKKLSELTYELYNWLFPYPVRPLVEEAGTVYIVPTGVLYALPFEMLVTKPAKRKTNKLHYLIEQAPIAYLTSASLLKILRDSKKRRVQTARYPLLAFANPVYDGSDFRPLPNTEKEAKAIANLFNPPPPRESEPLQLGENASVAKVTEFNDKTRLDDYQHLLFATHGVIPGESNNVDQPALVLSHPKPNGDGYLKMKDVFGLQLNAKLVSLSACNTGLGEQERGEGMMGLTRAFMYAGTPTVAVTLWAVNTYSTEQLNVGFFEQLTQVQQPAKALQTIKLKMLHGDNEKYRHPYYWAPFVLFGDMN